MRPQTALAHAEPAAPIKHFHAQATALLEERRPAILLQQERDVAQSVKRRRCICADQATAGFLAGVFAAGTFLPDRAATFGGGALSTGALRWPSPDFFASSERA
jgi:hypothetical protein